MGVFIDVGIRAHSQLVCTTFRLVQRVPSHGAKRAVSSELRQAGAQFHKGVVIESGALAPYDEHNEPAPGKWPTLSNVK
jgi:hypothetical protein